MATCPICGESVAEDAPICYKCGSAFVWPRAIPKVDHRRRLVVATWGLVVCTVAATVGGLVSYYGRHSGPQGSWPPALHVIIPVCTTAWFSSVASFILRRRQYKSARSSEAVTAEPAVERQPLAVPNRLMLS